MKTAGRQATDIDAWVEQNTVECRRFATRLQPSACALYRAEHPDSCAGCNQAAEAKPLPKRRGKRTPPVLLEAPAADPAPQMPVQEEITVEEKAKKKTSKPARPCICCGETGSILGRGLRSTCYWRHKRAGTLEQFPGRKKAKNTRAPKQPAAQVEKSAPNVPEWPTVSIAFPPSDEQLLQALANWAASERRSLDQQILFILDNTVAERASQAAKDGAP